MSLDLIIDGYNLLFSTDLVEGSGNLEGLRRALLQTLERYQAVRGHHVTVVFDGTHEGPASTETTHGRRLRVVFSHQGQTADEAIQQRLAGLRTETIVVTSDRALEQAASATGAVVVPVDTFASKVRQALGPAPVTEADEEADEEPSPSTRKRGNPRRASRRDRRRSMRLKKL
ncbi:MAG: NYN domain-containing protein [Nitrospinota bacterium]